MLCALNAVQRDPRSAEVQKAVAWLKTIQNKDGGWGEGGESYALDYAGYCPAPSTPSQTAWALLGLMAAGLVEDNAVTLGVRYLARPRRRMDFGRKSVLPRRAFPGSFFCAITATRNISRFGRWRATAISKVATGIRSWWECDRFAGHRRHRPSDEARVSPPGRGVLAIAGGGDAAGLAAALEAIVARKPAAILSFGVAGGLAPGLAPGSKLIARTVIAEDGTRYAAIRFGRSGFPMRSAASRSPTSLGSNAPLAGREEKHALHRKTGAHATDMNPTLFNYIRSPITVPCSIRRRRMSRPAVFPCGPAWRGSAGFSRWCRLRCVFGTSVLA